ncbi:DUF3267 domain-containing protein [Bacillus niameyensis]|uniref:DUF3267 domain-containing protein n=1 Tax=Bacillus niameyensis TaxID=1522308 RepID=UPI000784B921|nr:DUF3267 domain-containing protein [Bacillus niameyensis]
MQCWKAYNVNKKYQFTRFFVISTFIALFTFIALYVSMQTMVSMQLKDHHFIVFAILFILLYPMHKLLHILPLTKTYKYIQLGIEFYFYILPIIHVNIRTPISKNKYAFALLFPFFIINSVLIVMLFILPESRHFIAILLSYHIGMCAFDLIFLKKLFVSPRGALIEENEDGFEILVNK